MPCNSDYLEPTFQEKELQRAAKLLIFVWRHLDKPIPKWLKDEATNCYAMSERTIPALCDTLSGLSIRKRDEIVYNAKNKQSRDLADWWEDHQTADAKRIAEELVESENKKLRKIALKKLTTKEKRALGL
jgi:hypothetical protein